MSCAECHGAGTLFVLDGYVDQHAPLPTDIDGMDRDELSALMAKRAALRNTVYPCPECATERFQAWSKGQFAVAPLGTRTSVPVKARRGTKATDPLPLEPTWLGPEDWSETRRDLA